MPINFLTSTAVTKIFSDLNYFVKTSVLKIEAGKDDSSYTFLVPTNSNPQLEVQVPAKPKFIKKHQHKFCSDQKFITAIVNIFPGRNPS